MPILTVLVYLAIMLAYLAIGAKGLPAGWEVFAAVLAFLSPLILKYAPAKLKGKPMVVIAVVVSAVLGGVAMYFQGDFAHFDVVNVGTYLVSLAGLQQIFYALFKDNLNLSDPTAKQLPGQPAAYSTPSTSPPPRL